jgi:hypothetical protein
MEEVHFEEMQVYDFSNMNLQEIDYYNSENELLNNCDSCDHCDRQ